MEAVQERETLLLEIRTAVRHTAIYGVGSILAKAIGFLMLPVYTHYLLPADYGVLEILDLSMNVFSLILNMGLPPAFLRCYANANSAEEKHQVVSTGTTFGLMTGALAFSIGLALVHPVSKLLFGAGVPSRYVLLSFSSVILSYMATIPRTYLRALEKSGVFTIIETANVVLLLSLNIVFIVVLRAGLVGILWSSVISGLLQLALLVAWALRKSGVHLNKAHLRRMLNFGVPLIFANLGLFVLNFSDRFFLQHLRSLEVVGVYAVGYKFGYMMNYLFVQPFFVMWQSRMYAIHAQPGHPKIFKQVFMFYSLGLTYVGLAMSLFSSDVVRLMVDKKFAAGAQVIPVVVLAYVFYGLSYYAQLGLFLTDRTKLVGAIGTGAAALNLVLNYVLIRYYGMMGAAWATCVSFAAVTAVSYWCSQRAYRLPLNVGRLALGLALAATMYAFSRWLDPQSIAVGTLMKLAILILFPVITWRVGILPQAEAATISVAKERMLAGASRARQAFSRGAVNE